MDKPVSKPTAPAEPAPTLERNWKQGLPIGLAAIQQAKDAARYRWLRLKHDACGTGWHVRSDVDQVVRIGELDAAIDAAMKG